MPCRRTPGCGPCLSQADCGLGCTSRSPNTTQRSGGTHTLLTGTRPPTCRKLFTSANSDHHRDSNRNSSRASRFLVQERLFRVPTPLLQGCSHLAPKTWDLPYGETILKLSSHCESPDIMAEMHERSRKHSILWLAIISSIGPSKLVWGLHLKIPANSNPAPTPASTGPLLTMPD